MESINGTASLSSNNTAIGPTWRWYPWYPWYPYPYPLAPYTYTPWQVQVVPVLVPDHSQRVCELEREVKSLRKRVKRLEAKG